MAGPSVWLGPWTTKRLASREAILGYLAQDRQVWVYVDGEYRRLELTASGELITTAYAPRTQEEIRR